MSGIVQNVNQLVFPRCFQCRRVLYEGTAEIPISSILLCEDCYRTFTSQRSPAEIRLKIAEIQAKINRMQQEWGLDWPMIDEEENVLYGLRWVLKEGEEI